MLSPVWNGATNDLSQTLLAVADMIITAIEMQLSVAEKHAPALVESRVLVLLDLLEKMAKPFHGTRVQVRSSAVTFIVSC